MGIAALAAMSFGNSQRCNSALREVSNVALVEAAKARQLCESSVKDIASQCPGFNTGGLHVPIFPIFTTGSDAGITVGPESVPTRWNMVSLWASPPISRGVELAVFNPSSRSHRPRVGRTCYS